MNGGATSITPERVPVERARTRTSPYPERVRTSVQDTLPRTTTHRYQLIVQPIVKSTMGQRDTSGVTLDDLKPKTAGPSKMPLLTTGRKSCSSSQRRHLIESSKSETNWNIWLTSMRGETVKLLIYEYGVSITKAPDLTSFTEACVQPRHTDRAGATAECSLREIVQHLHDRWQGSFQGEAVVWRMWANHITRNLDRSTWDAAVAQPPPQFVASLLRAADGRHEQHISNVARSAHLALDCINAVTADYQQLRHD